MGATWNDLIFDHYVVRSDGAKFKNGQRDDQANTSWLTVDGSRVALGPGTYDEMLVVPYVATDDEALSWFRWNAPMYDTTEMSAIVSEVEGNKAYISAIGHTPQEISQTVAEVYPGGTGKQSTIQQLADQVALRVMAVDEYGNPIIGQLVLRQQGGKTFIVLDADQTLVGDLIVGGDLTIESPDGRAVVGPLPSGGYGFSAQDDEGNRSELTEGRLAFYRSGDNRPFYYVRHVEMGSADVGEYVEFDAPFESTPRVLVSVQELKAYDSSEGGDQYWRAFPEDVTPFGFTPRAQLEVEGTSGSQSSNYQLKFNAYDPVLKSISSADSGYPRQFSPVGTTSMRWDFDYNVDWQSGSGGYTNLLAVYIDYRKQGESEWIQAGSKIVSFMGSTSIEISGLDEAAYEWRIRGDYSGRRFEYDTATVTLKKWSWTENKIISQSGRVQWIAFEQ